LDQVRVKASFKPAVVSRAAKPSAAESNGFHIGQNVSHSKFGQGVILHFEGQGAHARVQVKFGLHGTKWLVLAYANLTAVENCSS